MATLNTKEVARYQRHLVLPHVGLAGQVRLSEATLRAEDELEALYLGAAGVGTVIVGTTTIAERVRAQNPAVAVCVDAATSNLERSALGSAHAALGKLRKLLWAGPAE